MEEAYKKALKVIDSCKTSTHLLGAHNYIHNFEIMYRDCDPILYEKLIKQLKEYCFFRRTKIKYK